MAVNPYPPNTLDPDWDTFEKFLNGMVHDVVAHLRGLREKPVWTRPGDETRLVLSQSAPVEGLGFDAAYGEFKNHILPHVTGNTHPNFLGWVIGSGAPASMVGDWLASFANGAPTLFNDSCLLAEVQVLEWMKALLALDKNASGVMTTGASEATLIALTAARYHTYGKAIKEKGVWGLKDAPVFYISQQTHDCARKAIEILGFGREHIRTISVDDGFRMRCDELAAAVQEDVRANKKPVAVIATLGRGQHRRSR